MSRESIILTLNDISDINKLKDSNIKYLNININLVDKEVIDYLKQYGQNYLYSENLNNINGYIYVDYDTFLKGELLIEKILSNIPNGLTEIELAKYLYISIGKNLGYDINAILEKNENFNLSQISTINNLWGALGNNKATNVSFCKIYLYLCKRLNIDCEIITVNNNGYLCNKLTTEGKTLIIDLTKDIPFIQARFKTRYFANYNDSLELDKKINYIANDYNENILDNYLKDINYQDDSFINEFLEITEKYLNIKEIRPTELGIIYDLLFNTYCPNKEININNLYLKKNNNKIHFILINYNNQYYGYNYNKQLFINIREQELLENIEKDNIGIYNEENIPLINNYKEVI